MAVDTSGMSGKLKVENSVGKNEYVLTPIEDSGLGRPREHVFPAVQKYWRLLLRPMDIQKSPVNSDQVNQTAKRQ